MVSTRNSAATLSSSLVVIVFAVAARRPRKERRRTAPGGAETPLELTASELRGRPYTGPRVETPRGLDGKPDLTGYWRPLREAGKPGGNLGKDEPGFILPFSDLGRRALLYSQNHTVDPEAVCILGGIPRHNGSGLPFEILHTPNRLATLYFYNTHRWVSIDENLEASGESRTAILRPRHRALGRRHAGDRDGRVAGQLQGQDLARREWQPNERPDARDRALDPSRLPSHHLADDGHRPEVLHAPVHVHAHVGARRSRPD